MILVPKRKYEQKAAGNSTINQYITNAIAGELSGIAMTLHRLWVKERLKIPVGTDKYG